MDYIEALRTARRKFKFTNKWASISEARGIFEIFGLNKVSPLIARLVLYKINNDPNNWDARFNSDEDYNRMSSNYSRLMEFISERPGLRKYINSELSKAA